MGESVFDEQMRKDPIGMTKALIAAHIQSALHMHPVTDEQADAAVAQLWLVVGEAFRIGAATLAAAERDGPEREAVAEAIVRAGPVATDDRNSWAFKSARQRAQAAAAALVAHAKGESDEQAG